jgi:hypothetical protein
MATWCTNIMRITGEPAEVERFILSNGDPLGRTRDEQRLTFRALVPIDRETDARPHWGVANDASNVEEWELATMWDGRLEASCDFFTPNEPPVAWFKAAAAAYPQLKLAITYDQLDFGFVGQLLGEDGQTTNRLWEDELSEATEES